MRPFELLGTEFAVEAGKGDKRVDGGLRDEACGKAGKVELAFARGALRFGCVLFCAFVVVVVIVVFGFGCAIFAVPLPCFLLVFPTRAPDGADLQIRVLLRVALEHAQEDVRLLGAGVEVAEALILVGAQEADDAVVRALFVEDAVQDVFGNFLVIFAGRGCHVLNGKELESSAS